MNNTIVIVVHWINLRMRVARRRHNDVIRDDNEAILGRHRHRCSLLRRRHSRRTLRTSHEYA